METFSAENRHFITLNTPPPHKRPNERIKLYETVCDSDAGCTAKYGYKCATLDGVYKCYRSFWQF